MCSMIDSGEKGYMLPQQILFNSLVLYLTQSNARQLFAADDFSRRHFQMHFFLGALKAQREQL